MPSHLSVEISAGLAELEINLNTILNEEALLFSEQLMAEVRRMQLGGLTDVAIFDILMADAAAGGRVFSQFGNAIRSQMFYGIQSASHIGEHAVYLDGGFGGERMEWITAQGGNICPDCEGRAGQVAPMEEWQAIGQPGSGWSVCRHHCQCRLKPVSVAVDLPNTILLEAA